MSNARPKQGVMKHRRITAGSSAQAKLNKGLLCAVQRKPIYCTPNAANVCQPAQPTPVASPLLRLNPQNEPGPARCTHCLGSVCLLHRPLLPPRCRSRPFRLFLARKFALRFSPLAAPHTRRASSSAPRSIAQQRLASRDPHPRRLPDCAQHSRQPSPVAPVNVGFLQSTVALSIGLPSLAPVLSLTTPRNIHITHTNYITSTSLHASPPSPSRGS
jgi:hypothetical protein